MIHRHSAGFPQITSWIMTSYPIAHVQNIGDAILEDGNRHDGDGGGHAAMLD